MGLGFQGFGFRVLGFGFRGTRRVLGGLKDSFKGYREGSKFYGYHLCS